MSNEYGIADEDYETYRASIDDEGRVCVCENPVIIGQNIYGDQKCSCGGLI
jgi:hypothetical protein